jgi:hypothetical protein
MHLVEHKYLHFIYIVLHSTSVEDNSTVHQCPGVQNIRDRARDGADLVVLILFWIDVAAVSSLPGRELRNFRFT